ncbi:hypothetical protein JWG41_08300 [Leptospira sp. 201903075]|uniref:hypothetical protein n=1 Tax=Leptospira chreensis TaxID=2810035 RepID=UPI001963712E|nr:hypothetical protein [Leptospira chreensis]MBM9590441.1 hypothetical protein [Leptospira chreensis]
MIKKIQRLVSDNLRKAYSNFKNAYTEMHLVTWERETIFYFSNFLISFILLYLHRPDSLNHPQLWAEDGTIFLRDEWVIGFPSTIFKLYSGYIHFVPRLIAFISDLFPYELIPFVFNASAILLAAFSVSLFSLSRFRYIVKNDFLYFAFFTDI